MNTHCQEAVLSGSGECQMLGTISSYKSRQEGRSTSNQKLSRVSHLCLSLVDFLKYIGSHSMESFVKMVLITFVVNFALRIYYFILLAVVWYPTK